MDSVKLSLANAGLIALVAVIVPRLTAQPQPDAPQFSVASVKPDPDGRQSMKISHGNLTLTSYPLAAIIAWAYHIPHVQLDMPQDAGVQRFAIMAKADSEVQEEEVRAMLRTLLAERFKLATHRETRQIEVTVMPPPKNTAALTPSANGDVREFHDDKGRQVVTFEHTTMEEVAALLSGTGPYTIDRTGLAGRYDFSVPYRAFIDRVNAPDDDTPEDQVSLAIQFRAWREAIPAALGIKLKRENLPLDVVVVDHIEPPTTN